ncbi:MAG: hypothetical protein KKA31_05400, partial [Candidatus Margulisbacteria bacterium]|nr:hypothetical protein [Candidatus Margulisiibacteriota bacterium]
MIIRLTACLLAIIILISGCSLTTNPSTPKKQWTLMLYLDGDEQAMQEDFLAAFREMISAEAGSSEDVNIVVQFDRLPTVEAFGGWTIAHRFYITPGMEPTPENAIADWGDGLGGGREVDTSDPNTLSSFISWAAANYPAEHYALLVGDHGYGWQGLVIDMTSKGNFMPLKGLRSALVNAGVRFDVLALDACLMAMIEVLHELRDAPVDIVVASENSGTTWDLANVIKTVTASPSITAEAFGRQMVDLYFAHHFGDPQITLSALRIAKAQDVSNAVKDLAAEILASSALTTIQTKAAEVMDNIEAAVVYNRTGASWEGCAGISIYFPTASTGT